ncbi:hypothetical protein [Streptomyces albipurpureus]|uniref:Uncharacterized protein n=1 Tax=Streptomyces albipurpureus TaxID=2897419 RepID=A0ABT0UVE1_9ACTN|nr:hypothetical protein [Streptomyces sp. CWNU-1]MCM2392553.1 hypothetical protein [Streptomyces sp. CWNU-1]
MAKDKAHAQGKQKAQEKQKSAGKQGASAKQGTAGDGRANDISDDDLLGGLTDEGNTLIMSVAAVFEREAQGAIPEAQRVEQRLNSENRIDPNEFEALLVRTRRSSHQLINLVSAQLLGGSTGGGADVAKNAVTDAHNAIDVLLNLARLTPQIAERIVVAPGSDQPTSRPKPV